MSLGAGSREYYVGNMFLISSFRSSSYAAVSAAKTHMRAPGSPKTFGANVSPCLLVVLVRVCLSAGAADTSCSRCSDPCCTGSRLVKQPPWCAGTFFFYRNVLPDLWESFPSVSKATYSHSHFHALFYIPGIPAKNSFFIGLV